MNAWFVLDLLIVSIIIAILTRQLSLVIFGAFIQYGLFIVMLCSFGQLRVAVEFFGRQSFTMDWFGWLLLFLCNAIVIFIAFEHRRWNRAHASTRIKPAVWQNDAPKVRPRRRIKRSS
ncbi:MAG: hypothetical protein AAF585_01825 [Verrucomicrobiota bacterium]